VIAAVRAVKGGVMLASGLNFAASVHLNVQESNLKIGFSSDQLLYKEPLDRAESRAILLSVLRQFFEKDFSIVIERVASNTQHRVILGVEGFDFSKPKTPIAQSENSNAVELDSDADTEVEFDAVGVTAQLPLSGPIDIDPLDLAHDTSHEKADSEAMDDKHLASAEVARQRRRMSYTMPTQSPQPISLDKNSSSIAVSIPVDVEAVRKHPLIKSVLKDCDGDIKRVTRSSGASPVKT
jgi:hypothetical protein